MPFKKSNVSQIISIKHYTAVISRSFNSNNLKQAVFYRNRRINSATYLHNILRSGITGFNVLLKLISRVRYLTGEIKRHINFHKAIAVNNLID